MWPRVRELELWDGLATLLIDGGPGEPARPPLHLQAAAGGYLRLVGPDGPVLWGLVDSGSYGIDIVRAKHAAVHALPPIRADDAERAPGATGSPEYISWWTRRYATLLCASPDTPLAAGRRHLLAPTSLVSARVLKTSAPQLVIRPTYLGGLLRQRDDFQFEWEFGYVGLLLVRELSDAGDGRVKMWRKRAHNGTLPPLVTWWCRGLYAHVLLDGHDRVHAALLEGVQPDVIVLADVAPNAKLEVEKRRQRALEEAAIVEEVSSMPERSIVVNAVLRTGWDPRGEWQLTTPGFPLDGGIAQWEREIRGTSLEAALVAHRDPARFVEH